MAVKQTAGREALGEFAPKFAELNDDVLFGQVWSRENKLCSFFRPDTSVKQMTETLVKAMDFYNKHLARQRKDRDAQ